MSRALILITLHHPLTANKFDIPAQEAHHAERRQEGRCGMHVQIDESISSVLIVEDEMIVAMMMEDLVRDLGVEDVYLAADAATALEILSEKSIDLAVLDLRVRDGSTAAVADALAERGIVFVFASGSDSGQLEDRHASRPMISKPFLDDDFKLVVLDTWTLARSDRPMGGTGSLEATTSD